MNITECEQLLIQIDANNAITVIPGQTISWYTPAVGGVLVASPTLSAVEQPRTLHKSMTELAFNH
ncbi:MAG: hypothetical protein IPN80_11035 [Flavobacterium sp.]|nr:hypothetical protein [Flavobacterium sp.]